MLHIHDVASGHAVDVEIVTDLTFAELAVVQAQWTRFRLQRQDFTAVAEGWDWEQKRLQTRVLEGRIFGLRCGKQIQGLIYLDSAPRPSAMGNMLHVRFIESAPWNRRGVDTRRYEGVGAALVADRACRKRTIRL